MLMVDELVTQIQLMDKFVTIIMGVAMGLQIVMNTHAQELLLTVDNRL